MATDIENSYRIFKEIPNTLCNMIISYINNATNIHGKIEESIDVFYKDVLQFDYVTMMACVMCVPKIYDFIENDSLELAAVAYHYAEKYNTILKFDVVAKSDAKKERNRLLLMGLL